MLSCREAEKMVMPFIDGQLDEQELEAFLNHIHGCPACKEELAVSYTHLKASLDSGNTQSPDST